ncbi:MAG TPA: 3-hydroxybenzoate 6-monooxygenase [Xanthobacteraceae bacterium]|nr:3-hydroxybenzoate 6-monooxygenase [Xanthobacteraceae bacterium]
MIPGEGGLIINRRNKALSSGEVFLIAGGGLGGLAAALGLARHGRRSIVLEQASQLGEIGAGIQMAPNAFKMFDYLGVGDKARRGAVFVDELVLMDALTGERIVGVPVGETFRNRFRNPYAVVHRADLHAALLEACVETGLVDLRVLSRVTGYEQDAERATAILADGTRVSGTALIGADGLWSSIRKQMVADGPPIVSGHTTYRSVIPTDRMPEDLRWNAATLWAGPKCHLVHYPLKGWEVFNLVITCHNDAPEPVAGKPVSKEEVRKGFLHVCARAQQIIDHGEDWKLWVLCDREPIQNWVDGRVALLGDAAHPMLQYFAQGACMALEDGVFLAHAIDSHGDDLHKALTFYNRGRAVRTASVQMGSRLIGDYIYHPDGAKADVRNARMSAMSADEYYDELAWLYDGVELPASRAQP